MFMGDEKTDFLSEGLPGLRDGLPLDLLAMGGFSRTLF